VLYEGRQIYFGLASEAKAYFEKLGFECPKSQTTPDFLTSMTSTGERVVKPGYENLAPRSSEDFARCWSKSSEREDLLLQIEQYNLRHPPEGDDHEHFALSRKMEKSKQQRENSPYTLSYWRQITLCMWREFQRIKNDPSKYTLRSL
jgi:ATP-binding cassette subfamily G (WHITE) protein 2 (PDR)